MMKGWIILLLVIVSGCAPGSMYVDMKAAQEKVLAPFRPAPPDLRAVVYPRAAGEHQK